MKLVDIENLTLDYGGLAYINPYDFEKTAMYFAEQIRNLPVVDAVEIVRCKDCCNSHFVVPCKAAKQNPNLLQYVCKKYGNVPQNHFCGYGKRK